MVPSLLFRVKFPTGGIVSFLKGFCQLSFDAGWWVFRVLFWGVSKVHLRSSLLGQPLPRFSFGRFSVKLRFRPKTPVCNP